MKDAQSRDFQQKKFAIDFWDYGEPLLHEKAVDYIREAAEAGIRCDLYTNGLLLTETSSQRLIESGLNALFIRLDTIDPETYARMHNTTPQTYEKTLNNLKTFLQLKKEHNSDEIFPWFPHVAAVMTLCEENKDHAMKFMEKHDRFNRLKNKFKRQNKEYGRNNVNVYAELYKSGPPVEYAVLRETNTYAGQSPLKKSPDYTPLTRQSCRQLYEGPYLLANGHYTICRQDINGQHTFGTIS